MTLTFERWSLIKGSRNGLPDGIAGGHLAAVESCIRLPMLGLWSMVLYSI